MSALELQTPTLETSVSYFGLESATAKRLPVGSLPCQGGWYWPVGRAPRVALIAAHHSADMSGHLLAQGFAARGLGFLGWNTRYRSGEDLFNIEHALVDVGAGVDWLRAQGVETIVLLGFSGGGSLMAAYQSQATAKPFSSPNKGLDQALQALAPGDLYVSMNAHVGRAEYLTSILDPAVVDESDPTITDPSLDMYDPANAPPYSQAFIDRYRTAQVARNQRITDWALAEQTRLSQHGYADRMFTIPRVWADLRYLDPDIDPSDRPRGLCYGGDPRTANHGVAGMARAMSLSTWLSLWSLERSTCRAAPHLANIHVPSLVVQSTGDLGVFPSDARTIHAGLAATDKTLHFVPGSHFLDQPANAAEDMIDLVVDWLRERTTP